MEHDESHVVLCRAVAAMPRDCLQESRADYTRARIRNVEPPGGFQQSRLPRAACPTASAASLKASV